MNTCETCRKGPGTKQTVLGRPICEQCVKDLAVKTGLISGN